MIDTRFPPQPQRTVVPLYPSQGNIQTCFSIPRLFRYSQSLESYLAAHYQIDSAHIELAEKGSYALFHFIKWLTQQYDHQIHIALPAFCCSEVCQAIMCAQAIPVFIDVNHDLSLQDDSIRFANQMGCKAIIWPQFFGDRIAPNLSLIRDLGMILINDEAQSFPTENAWNAPVTIFSFGHSKKLAASGGGGLCIQDRKLAQAYFNDYSKNSDRGLDLFEVFKHGQLVMKKQLINFNRPLAKFFQLTPHLESDLKVLLERSPFIHKSIVSAPITRFQKEMVMQSLKHYHLKKGLFRGSINTLKNTIKNKFNNVALQLIDQIEVPSIFAIQVEAKQRYSICKCLAAKGIQTTWYYYPLNRLSFLKQMPSEPTPHTDQIAAKILVLPLQWKHSQKQVRLLNQSMESL